MGEYIHVPSQMHNYSNNRHTTNSLWSISYWSLKWNGNESRNSDRVCEIIRNN